MTNLDISNAIIHLNSLYGRGDVVSTIALPDGRIKVIREPFRCRQETRYAKIIGRTIYFAGHQKTVKGGKQMTPRSWIVYFGLGQSREFFRRSEARGFAMIRRAHGEHVVIETTV